MAGLVIGRGGENLKRIEQQTMTRIQFTQGNYNAMHDILYLSHYLLLR